MKAVSIATLALFLLLAPRTGSGEMLDLQPQPADLYDLGHEYYYTWGLSTDEDVSGYLVTGACLKFENIRDWTTEQNVLYVHLLDHAHDGVRSGWDNQGGGDHFAGQGIELVTYHDLPSTPQDLVYCFGPEQLAVLNQYLQNGADIAIGFDPDCHFYNDGISLELGVGEIPEPACLTLVVLGAGVYALRLRRA